MELLDLPLEVLAFIVALVSYGMPCEYAPFSFRVLADCNSLRSLSQLRMSCKKLREACDVALGGVSSKVVGSDRWKFPMTLQSVVSLDCIVELTADLKYPQQRATIFELLSVLPCLKKLQVQGYRMHEKGEAYHLLNPFPSRHTLQVLKFTTVFEREQVDKFLSPEYEWECLMHVHLVGSEFPSSIPKQVQKTLRSFIVEDPSVLRADAGLLRDLSRAPNLHNLRWDYIMCKNLDNMHGERSFKDLSILSLVPTITPDVTYFASLKENMRENLFPKLKELRTTCASTASLKWFQSVLEACQATLEVLKLELWFLVSD